MVMQIIHGKARFVSDMLNSKAYILNITLAKALLLFNLLAN